MSVFFIRISIFFRTFAPAIERIALLFIRLVVFRFKVKIMLLDFQSTCVLVSVAVATVLSVYTLTHINIR